jgi:hypothetical protein
MASAHVIEVDDVTAGIVVLDQGSFRFFSSERLFDSLEGARFRTIDQAVRAARERLRLRKTHDRPSSTPNPKGAGDLVQSRFRSDWGPA